MGIDQRGGVIQQGIGCGGVLAIGRAGIVQAMILRGLELVAGKGGQRATVHQSTEVKFLGIDCKCFASRGKALAGCESISRCKLCRAGRETVFGAENSFCAKR